ncbi:Methylmalonyl-CoA carboxyltransferase 1.3S subunit [compost metagenome]|jgi:biotin carboxyl carrier protein|uniref:Acetyl-CoA carboxylase biotin carboxyl carrier protein subunit n=1 Tax=Cupriavidus campinensis TaxID=151783 RepID=A0AAE9I5Z2_9BURK|nr:MULTISPECIES: acetyl-CoA carboxylase biotin carboxyl carrier protein subunit [Cupriavidus]TSP14283.1 biotin/lipoyl-binding protein [Cupriavidus campinensis]URF05680.1 acetyl-CoA carboxylase biotin carboxyl carrier protein subunit [Cupriavidus campinensis]CAG2144284.1 Methylmalonyl-CoA carboxyltransferase 1.3S subunit [Cupriavidus campinensis]SFD38431.1 Biotin-requiring enzyme [Cupriavidus sp. OV038]SFQ08447.1 Biotin-requiring enzyme [Cupriavidus sp. OV096]
MPQIDAAVSGHVSSIAIEAGATISAGDVLMIIESMKMEIPLEAEADGVVKAILVQPGDAVTEGQPVVEVE